MQKRTSPKYTPKRFMPIGFGTYTPASGPANVLLRKKNVPAQVKPVKGPAKPRLKGTTWIGKGVGP